ncbi:MAG: prolyl oligopeptidase family serine peptidase [Actinomycetota bacterium]
MKRDIRDTPLYREIEEHFTRRLGPGFGRVTGADHLAPSPDGLRVAFTGSKLEKLEGSPTTRICLADVESGEVTEITHGPNDDSLPRWSPDGRRLAFLSDRTKKGRNQLFVLARDLLGEAETMPEMEGSVEYHAFSPDGRRILLGVAEPGAERGVAEGSGRIDTDDDLPDWIPIVRESEGRRRLHVVDIETREVRVVSRDGLTVWEAAWCGPDRIAAIVSDDPSEEAWFSARLVMIDAGSGRDRDLLSTGRPDRQLGFVAAAPSGAHLALVRAVASDRGYLEGDVVLVDPESGSVTEIDPRGADASFVSWRDDDRLVFLGTRRRESVGGQVDARTGAVTDLWMGEEAIGGRHGTGEPIGDDGFVAVLESYDRPPEIAVFREGKPETVVSFAHDGTRFLSERGGRVERLSWTAQDGVEIDGFVVIPDGPGPHPLVVDVHGGPIGAHSNRWSMGYATTPLLVSRGCAVLLANPRGSTGRGQAFQEAVIGDMGGADAADVLAGIDAVVERGIADPARVGVMGGSYGGFMTAWLVTRTDRFAAAVAISPVTDYYSQHWTSNIGFWDRTFLGEDPGPGGAYFERSPVMFADRVRTPTLLTAGTEDRCTPPGQAVEFHQALREHGIETDLAIYPGEGHGVRKYPAYLDFCTRLVDWFERHMPAPR